jgi:short-subunit dehydrogenase
MARQLALVAGASSGIGLSLAKELAARGYNVAICYQLRDTGITVTALQPGPTDTDFFHRAGMDNTELGSESMAGQKAERHKNCDRPLEKKRPTPFSDKLNTPESSVFVGDDVNVDRGSVLQEAMNRREV